MDDRDAALQIDQRHLSNVHEINKFHVKSVCLAVKMETTETHPKKHICTFEGCQASFGRPGRLTQHFRIHTGERPYQCHHKECNHSFTRPSHLKRHIDKNHSIATISPTFLCPVDGCGSSFVTEQNLRKHHERKHTSNSSIYKCEICDKSFRRHHTLKSHQFEHTGIHPFKCTHDDCSKSFLLLSKLKAHSKVHQGYLCDVAHCSEYFKTWSLLRKHKAEVHPKIHECPICHRLFKRIKFLNEHLPTHQDHREMFHCPIENCDRWYYSEKNVRSHIRLFHTPGQFKCEHEGCGKVFVWKASLKSHAAHHHAAFPKESNKIPRTTETKKTRSDKGKPKKAMAALLSGVTLCKEENDLLLRNVE